MRIEFSWTDPDGSFASFTTGCPKIAEAMIRSSSDFPQVPSIMKDELREKFGDVSGKYEVFLRDQINNESTFTVESGISELTLRVRDDLGIRFC